MTNFLLVPESGRSQSLNVYIITRWFNLTIVQVSVYKHGAESVYLIYTNLLL